MIVKETVTHQENCIRVPNFGKHNNYVKGENHPQSKKTHCPHGHEYTKENTRLYRGRRFCRQCSVISSKNYRSVSN